MQSAAAGGSITEIAVDIRGKSCFLEPVRSIARGTCCFGPSAMPEGGALRRRCACDATTHRMQQHEPCPVWLHLVRGMRVADLERSGRARLHTTSCGDRSARPSGDRWVVNVIPALNARFRQRSGRCPRVASDGRNGVAKLPRSVIGRRQTRPRRLRPCRRQEARSPLRPDPGCAAKPWTRRWPGHR